MRILTAAATTLPLVLTSIALSVLPATPSLALPMHASCVITSYYKTASLDQQVGQRTKCTGSPAQMSGRASPYHTIEIVSAQSASVGNSNGSGGSLPCEFLEAGCSDFPTNRFE